MAAPSVTSRVIDQSFGIPQSGSAISGIVIHSDRGPTEITQVTSKDKFVQLYGEPKSKRPSMIAALELLKESSRVKVLRAVNDAEVATVDVEKEIDSTTETIFTINAENPGAWGNDISVSFTKGGPDEDLFDINVLYSGTIVESFRVSHIDGKKDGFGNSVYLEDAINGISNYITIDDDASFEEKPEIDETVELSGGADDTTAPDSSEIATAWEDFNNKSDVAVDFLVNGGWASSEVQTKMIDIAEDRRDCFAFLDVPESDDSVSGMTDYVDPEGSDLNTNTSFAAVYGHWVRQYDEFNDKRVTIPPSVVAAGIATRSRDIGEIWDAPAGLRRGRVNALGVTNVLGQADMDTLYENNVNPITQLPGQGLVVWGQKTLQRTASALDRINVRFLVTHIEKTLSEALLPFVFQPNTAFERENVESLIDTFLEDIQTRQGLYNYNVIVDETNNTPEVIDRNEMIIDVFLQPTRTAEQIKLNVTLTPTGVELS